MKKNKIMLVLGFLFCAVGFAAWVYQFVAGMIVTDMRNSFTWGLYIATFAFFVGVAAGGMIISSSIYLFRLESLRPFARIASLSAFGCVMAAGAIILPDMGRTLHIYQIFLTPNLRSPLVWDVAVVCTYLVVTFLSVYMQMLPDWVREGRGIFTGWAKKKSEEGLYLFSKKWSRRVALFGLPVAVLIHTVTALIFATQNARHWWYTAILPPDFIAMAVASGTGLVMLVCMFAAGRKNFQRYQEAYGLMARIAGGALIVHFFFTAMELLLTAWNGTAEGQELLHLLFGTYGWLYGLELILPAIAMVLYFTAKGRSNEKILIACNVMVVFGAFVHRVMLMYPAFNLFPLSLSVPGSSNELWSYPIASGAFTPGADVFVTNWAYTPTLIEWLVNLLPFGLAIVVIVGAMTLYRFIPEEHPAGAGQTPTEGQTVTM